MLLPCWRPTFLGFGGIRSIVPCWFSSRLSIVSQVNAIVVSITLDGQNYPEWAFSVETTLRGCGLLSHLSEDKPELKTDRSMLMLLEPGRLMMGK